MLFARPTVPGAGIALSISAATLTRWAVRIFCAKWAGGLLALICNPDDRRGVTGIILFYSRGAKLYFFF